MRRKIIISFLLLSFCFSGLFYSQTGNNTQIIKQGHWIYDDLYTLFSENKISSFIDNQPMSYGEIKFYFSELDYEKLSASGKELYDALETFLHKNDNFFGEDSALKLYSNPKTNIEFYYKSNINIPWSFDYAVKDRFVTLPVVIGFSDYITIGSDFFIGKNYSASHSSGNFTNIPYSFSHIDMSFQKFSYFSSGLCFDSWGMNFHAGKEGLTIGNTKLGSIIYNETFETNFYSQLNVFTKRLKYSMDVSQVENDTNKKYIFLHQLNLRPFKNFKFGVIEGSLLDAPFELKYLTPLTVMHNFFSWFNTDITDTERKYYNEGHFGAYLCFTFEYIPFENFRIYGYYSQNEILDWGWEHTDDQLCYPDSLGGQLGFQFTVPLENNARIISTAEFVYTSPYLYIKQSPDWSFWSKRTEQGSGEDVCSWIGSPFGPDCFAAFFSCEYKDEGKWNLTFEYLFKIKGQNNSLIFDRTKEISGENIYIYYPYAQYIDSESELDKLAAINKGRYMWMTGIPEYSNRFSLYGEYKITKNISLYAKCAYSFAFNSNNLKNVFDQGIEFGIGCEYMIFK